MEELDVKFGTYEIHAVRGRSSVLVISCSGIGLPHENKMAYEWKSSISKIGDVHAIYFLDWSRSWYNAESGFSEALSFIQNYIKSNNITEVHAVGLSMGAYGVLVLSRYLDLTSVSAISSRATLNMTEIDDPRNSNLIRKIVDPVHDYALGPVSKCSNIRVLFSVDDEHDVAHAALMASRGDPCSFMGYHGVHNIGDTLVSSEKKIEFIAALIRGDQEKLRCLGFFSMTKDDVLAVRDFHKCVTAGHWDELILDGREIKRHLIPRHAVEAYDGSIVRRPSLTTESFVKISTAPRFLRSGWSPTNENGAWAVGDKHIISFSILDADTARRIIISLDMTPYVNDLIGAQSLTIICNGVVAFRDSYTPRQTTAKPTFEIPASSEIDIVFMTPDAISPFEIGKSSDKRRLSFFLRSLSIKKK